MSEKYKEKISASEKFFENIVEMDPKINKNFFRQTEFKNKEMEDLFKSYQKKSSFIQNTLGDVMLLLGYIANLIYIFTAYYRNFIFIYCLIIMLLTFVLIVLSYKMSNNNLKKFLPFMQVFLISFFMNSKVFFIIFFYSTPENDNGEEILRIIIYDYISTNLFILVKLEGGISVNLFYFFINMFSTLTANYYSLKNHYLFLEVMTSFFLLIIFYSFRKIWAYKIRYVFAEKYKYKNLYSYTYDFLNGFNGFQINFKNRTFIDCNKKFSNFLTHFIESNKESNCYTEDSKFFEKSITESNYSNQPHLNLLNKQTETEVKERLFNTRHKKISNLEKKEKESIEIFLDSLIEIEHSNADETTNKYEKERSETEIREHSLNSLLKKLFKDESNFNKNLYLGIFELNNLKMRNLENLENDKNDINLAPKNKDSNTNINNKSNKNALDIEIKKSNSYFDVFFRKIRFYGDIVIYNIILYDVSELIITKMIYEQEINIKQQIFSKIENEFYHPLNKINSSALEITNNITFFESNPQNIEKFNKIEGENLHKNKNRDKELKIQNKIETINLVEKIHNLSQYLIFLVNNILFIAKGGMDDLKIYKPEKECISLKPLMEHCFEILKILIGFYRDKKKKIKPEIIFEKNNELENKIDLKKLFIYTDSLKIKQLLFNFISNSVKYTKRGNISLICKYSEESIEGNPKNCLIITVKDTGIGLNSLEKKKLLLYLNSTDGQNYDYLNNVGNNSKKQYEMGLGFFIIKSIANSLKYKIKFKSDLGKGTEFLIIVPLEQNKLFKQINTEEDKVINFSPNFLITDKKQY